MLTATSFPITCEQTIVTASHCVGFTLPGIIEEPGSFAGRLISPIPLLGPDESILISLAIFMSDTATDFRAPEDFTIASFAAKASNLLFAEENLYPVISDIFFATNFEYPFGVFKPVPTAVPPSANSER